MRKTVIAALIGAAFLLPAQALACVPTDTNPCAVPQGPFGPSYSMPRQHSGGLGPKPRASCGWYMRAQFGGRYGPEFNRARAWAGLPRTTLSPGAVVVSSRKGTGCGGPCGHVVRVVSVIDHCRAVVQDNRGTYERNTCKNRVAVVRA